MNVILTNIGQRFINEQLKINSEEEVKNNVTTKILFQVLKEKKIQVPQNKIYDDLVNNGFLEVENEMDLNAIDFKYKTNPLENVKRIVFEFTTYCNFNCAHCRNGYTKKTTETNIEKLKSVVDIFNLLNVKRYDFIGGEVTKYGNGWLEVADYIKNNKDKIITVYTNGWWLENTDFQAAGKFYRNDVEYLTDLKQNGITHILFSIDGHEEYHDKSRNHKGLYKKIINSFERIIKSGIEPRITAILFDDLDIQTAESFADIATRMYNIPQNLDLQSKINYLTQDPTNHFSNFIDIGNGVKLKKNKKRISDIPPDVLRCKAFYRPSPSLRIMANGNLSVCPLLDAGEDYGNIHDQSIIEILNNFQKSFAYKLHATREINNYLKYLDTSIFGEHFDHICSIRVILTLLAIHISSEKTITRDLLFEINKRIAKYSGHE